MALSFFLKPFGISSPKEGAVGRWTVWNDFQEYSSISSEEEDEAQPSSCHSQCEHQLHVMYVSYLILWNISVKHDLSCPCMSIYIYIIYILFCFVLLLLVVTQLMLRESLECQKRLAALRDVVPTREADFNPLRTMTQGLGHWWCMMWYDKGVTTWPGSFQRKASAKC